MPQRSDALAGVSVALLESRMRSEMGALVRRFGGTPRFAPAVRETPRDCRDLVARFLDTLERPAARVSIFLTGVGATVLFDEAERQGRLSGLVAALERSTIACRGPKPSAALKRRGLTCGVCAAEPYTSVELLEAIDKAGIALAGTEALLVHYGERSTALASALAARGAALNELCLYEWQLPEDTQPLRDLVGDVLEGSVGAVVFTSQIQARHLLQIAGELGVRERLVDALNTRVVVASVGPVCSAALEESGIHPAVVPASPKMAPLISELAAHFAGPHIQR